MTTTARELVEGALAAAGSTRRGNDWTCPVHEDRTPSLSVNVGDDGRVLMHCHAGCATEDVCAALGLTVSDLMPARPHTNGYSFIGSIVDTYRYVDEMRRPLFEVVRFEPKGFRQRLPNGEWGITGARRVLYRLPELRDAVAQCRRVWIAEGEKDVHALEAVGEVATCNPGGAGKWRPDYSEHLRGAEVAIVRHRDETGRDHAEDVARSLDGVARSVRIVEPAVGNDAADHLTAGRALEELIEVYAGDVVPSGGTGEAVIEAAGLRRFDVATALISAPPEPDWFLEGFIERGELVWIAGPGKSGKSLVALFMVCSALAGAASFLGRQLGQLDWCVYIDCENRDRIVHRRLQWAGVPAAIADRLDYLTTRSFDIGSPAGLAALELLVDRPGRGAVVLDSMIGLHRADEDKAVEVRQLVLGIRSVLEVHGITCIGLTHENRTGNLRGSLDWRNAADTVLELRKDQAGWRTLTVGDRRDGPEDGRLAFRLVETPNPGGPSPILAIESGGGPLGGPSVPERLASQLREMMVENPSITRRQAALAVKRPEDDRSFKSAWAMTRPPKTGDQGQGGHTPRGGPGGPHGPFDDSSNDESAA